MIRPGLVEVSIVWERGWTYAEGHHLGEAEYSSLRPEEKTAAVRMVSAFGVELGVSVQRVAAQLGYGTESMRSGVRQANIDVGHQPGPSTQDAEKLASPRAGKHELERANEIVKSAASFSGAGLDRQHQK